MVRNQRNSQDSDDGNSNDNRSQGGSNYGRSREGRTSWNDSGDDRGYGVHYSRSGQAERGNESETGNRDYDYDMRYGRSGIERESNANSGFRNSGSYSDDNNRSSGIDYGTRSQASYGRNDKDFERNYGSRYGHDYERENYGSGTQVKQHNRAGESERSDYSGSERGDYDRYYSGEKDTSSTREINERVDDQSYRRRSSDDY